MSKGSLGLALFTTIKAALVGRFWTAGLVLAVTLTGGSYAAVTLTRPAEPTPVQDFAAPFVFGRFSVPADNPLTEEAFELGRHLFYDPCLLYTSPSPRDA